ncbi:MAG: class B sortase [Lachnospiraceae bacterium]|nr:class B sortase [Lachnospiraceae bacterium]
MEKGKNDKQKNKVWLGFSIFLIIVAIISADFFVLRIVSRVSANKRNQELRDQVNDGADTSNPVIIDTSQISVIAPKEDEGETGDTAEPVKDWSECTMEEKKERYLQTYGIIVPDKTLNFDDLKETVNKDIYAWIYIPNLDVDDPIVQHPDDDAYYLNHNLDGTAGYPGGIYTEPTYNNTDFMDRMTVVYGHNMRDDKRFSSLHRLEDPAVFEEVQYLFIYMPDDILVYKIVAAYEGSNLHILATNIWDDVTWVEYLNGVIAFDGPRDNTREYDFTSETKMLTLSTCIKNDPSHRYLVQGVLLDECR